MVDKAERFLSELVELCKKYQIGIEGSGDYGMSLWDTSRNEQRTYKNNYLILKKEIFDINSKGVK